MDNNRYIPNDWLALSTLVALNPRQAEAGQAGLAWHAGGVVLTSALRAETVYVAEQAERRRCYGAGRPHAWPVQNGDVVLPAKWRADLAGQVASVVCGGMGGFGHCAAPAGYLVLRPDPSQLDSGFLAHLLRYLAAPGGVLAEAAQAGFGLVPMLPLLRRLRLRLPSLAQQQALVAELNLALANLWQRQSALAALDQARRRAFTEFFGSTSTLLATLPHATLGQVVQQILLGKADWRNPVHAPGWHMLRAHHVTWNRLHPLPAHPAPLARRPAGQVALQAGDVLLGTSCRGGGAAVVPDGLPPTRIGPGLALLRGHLQEPGYLAAFLCSGTGLGEIERVANYGRNDWLGREAIAKIRLPLPPRAKQVQFLQQRQGLDQDCANALAAWQQAQSALQQLQQHGLHGALF